MSHQGSATTGFVVWDRKQGHAVAGPFGTRDEAAKEKFGRFGGNLRLQVRRVEVAR